MDRVMPAHLKQYQGGGAHMPARIEHEMAAQMQKNLPAHMQQYVEPYMHQNVIYGAGNVNQTSSLRTSAPTAQAYKPVQTQTVLPNDRSSRRSLRNTTSSPASAYSGNGQEPGGSNPKNEYEFIMNPGTPPKKPLLNLGEASMLKRGIFAGAGLLILIMVVSVIFSFLNGAGRAHQDRLLEIAQTQSEIIRVAESAQEKIGERDLLFLANNVVLTFKSSQQDIASALTERGIKKVEKKLTDAENPENDAVLIEGEQNGKFDETYRALLEQQLNNYGIQLQAAYEGSNAKEKQILETAFSQIDLLVRN